MSIWFSQFLYPRDSRQTFYPLNSVLNSHLKSKRNLGGKIGNGSEGGSNGDSKNEKDPVGKQRWS